MTEILSQTIIFGEVELYLPKTASHVALARRLLDLFEGDILKPQPSLQSSSAEHDGRCRPQGARNSYAPSGEATSDTEKLGTIDTLRRCQGQGRGEVAAPELSEILATPGFDSPASPFTFKECEPFKWFGLPTFRAGKTMYHLCQGRVHIMREGYESLVFITLEDLKRLNEVSAYKGRGALRAALPFKTTNNKYSLICGFLNDVDFAKIGSEEHRITAPQEKPQPKSDEARNIFVGAAKQTDKRDPALVDAYKTRKDRVQEGLNEGLSVMAIASKHHIPMREVESIANILKKNGGEGT